MSRFYLLLLGTAVSEWQDAADRIIFWADAAISILLVSNRAWAKHVVADWQGFSPWWAIAPLSALLVFKLLRTNYQYALKLTKENDALTFPENRPQLLFDGWGEVPHDHPEAEPWIASDSSKEPEYFRRGIFITNDGETAHEVNLHPICLQGALHTSSPVISRIAAREKGFIFVMLDLEQALALTGEVERWDLLSALSAFEAMVNAGTIRKSIEIPVSVSYRNSNVAWFLSSSTMLYTRGSSRITFGPTVQTKLGLKPPS